MHATNVPAATSTEADAMTCDPPPALKSGEGSWSALDGYAGHSVFQLIVRCAPSQGRVKFLLRQSLAEELLSLKQRFMVTASGKPLCTFQAVARGGRASCRRVVALLARLEEEGVCDVRWESVVQPLASGDRPRRTVISSNTRTIPMSSVLHGSQ